jgi:formylmethanofuran dehydrogenase subunit B
MLARLQNFVKWCRPMAAYVKGAIADYRDALARAAELLGRAKLPVIGGLATDMAGARSGFALAQKLGGVVDHLASEGLMRQNMVMRQTGAFSTTFGETRNRAGAIVIVGQAPFERDPDLIDKLCGAAETLPRPGKGRRQLILMGAQGVRAPQHFDTTEIPVTHRGGLPTVLALLAADVAGRRWARSDAALDGAVEKTSALLRESGFSVFVYAPDELSEPVLHTLLEMARALSHDSRASTLAIPAPGNGDGANLLSIWTCGLPLRTSLAQIVPEHDPWTYDARRLIESGEADALVWVESLGEDGTKRPRGVPTVVLSANGASAEDAEILIETARPGRDHDAALYLLEIAGIGTVEGRGEKSEAPTAAAVLEALASLIAEREASRC